jgi:hypothetical protein
MPIPLSEPKLLRLARTFRLQELRSAIPLPSAADRKQGLVLVQTVAAVRDVDEAKPHKLVQDIPEPARGESVPFEGFLVREGDLTVIETSPFLLTMTGPAHSPHVSLGVEHHKNAVSRRRPDGRKRWRQDKLLRHVHRLIDFLLPELIPTPRHLAVPQGRPLPPATK